MGRIFYIMGKSATGKDTIYAELKKDPELDLHTVILYTTRPIRENEKDGVDYYFIQECQTAGLLESGKVIEMRAYETICGIWRYFTLDDGQFRFTDQNYLMIGTLESYRKMQDYFGEERLVPLYITVCDETRLERALGREKRQKRPKYAEVCRRYLADEADFSEENLRKAGIKERFLNDSLMDCVRDIKNYMMKF